MKSHKKILIINWQDIENPYAGGAEVRLFETFKRLREKYEIHLLCSRFKGGLAEGNIDGIYIHRIGKRNTFNFFVPSAYQNLNKRYKFDLVIEDINKIPFFGRFYIQNKRLAISHHLFGKVIFQETNPIFGLYVYLTEKLIGYFYKDIPFISVSKGTKEDLIKYGISPAWIKVIYAGADIRKYYPGKKPDKPFIVLIGRLKKYKRVDIFLKAISLLRDDIQGWDIKIVGGGDDIRRLKKVAEKLRLENIVEFTGVVSEQKKANILRQAWASVNTSTKEGWGLTSMEAQASGTLSIVPDSPGLRETVIHNKTGFIYPYGDVKKLKEYLKYVVENQNIMLKMGKSARKWAEKFTWEKTAKEVDKIIEDIIEPSYLLTGSPRASSERI